MFERFEDIKTFVLSGTLNESENKRITEEISLFESRNWEDYVTIAVNLLSQLSSDNYFFVHFSKSTLDSYFIYKALNPNKTNDKLLHSVINKEILFNDTLRLDIECVGIVLCLQDRFNQVATIVDNEIKRSNLHYYESLLECDRSDDKGELIIVSQNNLSDSEIEEIIDEKTKNASDDLIRDCLLIRLFFRNRL